MTAYLVAMRIKLSAARRVWPGETVELADDGPETDALLALGAIRPLPQPAPATAQEPAAVAGDPVGAKPRRASARKARPAA